MSSDVEEERPKKQRRAPKRKAHSDSEGEEDEKPKKQEKKKPGKRTTVPDRVQVQCTVTSDGKFAIQSKAPRVKKEPSPEELEKKKKRASSSSASSSTTTTVNKFADEFSLKGSFVATNFEAFNKTNARVIVKHVESGTTAPMDVLPFFEIAWKKLNVADVQWTGTARIEQVGAKIGLTFAADQKQQQPKKEKQQQKDSKEEKQAAAAVPPAVSAPAVTPSAPAVSPFGF